MPYRHFSAPAKDSQQFGFLPSPKHNSAIVKSQLHRCKLPAKLPFPLNRIVSFLTKRPIPKFGDLWRCSECKTVHVFINYDIYDSSIGTVNIFNIDSLQRANCNHFICCNICLWWSVVKLQNWIDAGGSE